MLPLYLRLLRNAEAKTACRSKIQLRKASMGGLVIKKPAMLKFSYAAPIQFTLHQQQQCGISGPHIKRAEKHFNRTNYQMHLCSATQWCGLSARIYQQQCAELAQAAG